MTAPLFTIACEFQGGTFISQMRAADELDAVRRWGTSFATAASTSYGLTDLAALAATSDEPPVALQGLTGVWCWTASVDGMLALLNVIRTAA